MQLLKLPHTNRAHVYDLVLGDHDGQRRAALNWNPEIRMDREHISWGFYINPLILDYIRRGEEVWHATPLSFPHSGITH
jgi:hypothetical protein